MEEAILALQIAVRDAERTVKAQWDEVQKLEEEISELKAHLDASYDRYENSADWLEGLERGLNTLEQIQLHSNVQATH